MAEVLYPGDLIRRTYRAIREDLRPEEIDQAIELIDVRDALEKMPEQYQRAISIWYDVDGDQDEIAMELHCSTEVAATTLKSAWSYLYTLLNKEPT